MQTLLGTASYMLNMRAFLWLLLVVNALGTIYGYVWYGPQLAMTEPQFYVFVPDSPTASLFFCFVIVGWLLGKHFKLMEVLALVTLVKYGIWAVVMNILTFIQQGELGWMGWMLVASHGLMAVQALLYLPKYRFTYGYVVMAAIWTLHNDVIDYVFGQMPIYRVIYEYTAQVGYFTFWLSVVCIYLALFVAKKHNHSTE